MAALRAKQRALDEAEASGAMQRTAAEDHRPGPLTVNDVPAPHGPSGDGDLSAQDLAELQVCEGALDNARLAFAAAGKALATVQQARLYRNQYDTFEQYTEERWGMGRQYAYRLIAAWPLAARLSPIGDKLSESHVRELLPLAKDHGEDTAVTAYETVTTARNGARVTAQLLHDMVVHLGDDVDPETIADIIRAWLAEGRSETAAPRTDPLPAALDRDLARLSRRARSDPKSVRAEVARIRAKLDEIERGLA